MKKSVVVASTVLSAIGITAVAGASFANEIPLFGGTSGVAEQSESSSLEPSVIPESSESLEPATELVPLAVEPEQEEDSPEASPASAASEASPASAASEASPVSPVSAASEASPASAASEASPVSPVSAASASSASSSD